MDLLFSYHTYGNLRMPYLHWGLNPKITTIEKLKKLQRVACQAIIHCPKSTSIPTMEVTTGILLLSTVVDSRARTTLLRLHGLSRMDKIVNYRTKLIPHSSSFTDSLHPTIENWDITRMINFSKPSFHTIIADDSLLNTLKSSHQSILDQYQFSCFTVGSKVNGHTGASLVVYWYTQHSSHPSSTFKWRLHDSNSVFQAELAAIEEACKLLLSLPSQGSSVAIFTDSLSSVSALSRESSSSLLCIKTRHSPDKLASTCHSVNLTWIRGHAGIIGNETADSLAKLGTSCESYIFVPLPLSFFKATLKEASFDNREQLLAVAVTSNPLRPLLIHFSSSTHTKFFQRLERRNSRVLTAFLDNKAH
jgi:ribonuclease HI